MLPQMCHAEDATRNNFPILCCSFNDAAEPQPVDEAASLAPTPPLRGNKAGSLVHEMRASQQQFAN